MECPNCQTANPKEARFCMKCGQSLTLSCPNCDTELPAGAAFCFNCGHKIGQPVPEKQPPAPATPSASRLEQYIPPELLAKLEAAREGGAMEGERRIVTMLFCDVRGSTAAAGRLDPEEWADILNGAFEYMINPVYKYEGTIARLMGDAILAFFGAPIAHEDDPQRAVLAGLEILEGIQAYCERVRRQWQIDLDVRVGINTGLVVVGSVGSDLRMEYTALGEAINLAARMEQTAQPGTLPIAHPTYKLVAPLFDVEDLGDIQVKGKEEPVRAYRVLRAKAEPGRLRGIEGLESPLVGREAELHALQEAVNGLYQGRGQVVSIMGEAGLGKSRLIAELHQNLPPASGEGQKLQWVEGRSLSYENNTPYTPFIDLLERCFDLEPGTGDQEKLSRMMARVGVVLPDRVEEIVPLLATMMEIPLTGEAQERVKYLEPPQLRAGIFQAAAGFFEALAAAQPLVLVFDDLHWADPTSLELLEGLLPLTDRTMLMIVALFRRHRQESSWRFHEIAGREYAHRYTAVDLKPLDEDQSRSLVANLLHVEGLPEKVRSLILTKAEGNPFYVEEVIRSLLDASLVIRQNGHWVTTREIEDIAVPDTLTAVLTTRLDRLKEADRRALQTAAVIGRQFRYDTLLAVLQAGPELDASIAELQRRELIREKERLPVHSYAFKHALTRETAYNSLLLKRRVELHRRIGEHLEVHDSERVHDIARHFLEARELKRALPFTAEAGHRAARAYSTAEAVEYYEQSLKILETVDDKAVRRRVYEGLGNVLTLANDIPRAIQTYQDMLAYGEEHEDVPMQVSALNKLSFVYAMRMGQFDEAEKLLNDADRRARAEQDKAGLSEMGLIRCMMCTAVADFDGVVRYMDETVSLSRDLAQEEQIAMGLSHIASSQVFMLQFDRARETFEEGLALSRKIGDREHEAELLTNAVAIYYFCRGDLETAQKTAKEGLEIARRIGFANGITVGERMLGQIAQLQGRYEEALAAYQRYLETSRSSGLIWFEVEALCFIGSTYLEISPAYVEKTRAYHEEAVALLEQPGGAMMGGTSWAELGHCAHAVGAEERAESFFQLGLTVPTITGNLERPRLLAGSAAVAMVEGDLEKSLSLAREAEDYAREHNLVCMLPQVALTLAGLSARRGDPEAALAAYEQAASLAEKMGMLPLVWQAKLGAARVLQGLGRSQEAQDQWQAGQVTIAKIADLIQDEAMRAAFQTSVAEKTAQEAGNP